LEVIWRFQRGSKNQLPKIQFEGHLIHSKDWKDAKLIAFDAPLMYASSFEERTKFLKENIAVDHPFIKVSNLIRIGSERHLMQVLKQYENVITRKPRSRYMEYDSCSAVLSEKQSIYAMVLETAPSLKLKDAHGKIYHCISRPSNLDLPLSSIVTLRATHKQLDGSFLSTVKEIRNDLNWTSLCQESYPYYVSTGLSSKAACRSCGYQFQKSELRIKTLLLRNMQDSIRPCPINMCINWQCITLQSFMKVGKSHRYQDWQLEPFEGKIRVPSDISHSQLPHMEGIEWIK